MNVLFNELMESVQKLLSTIANLQQSLTSPSGDGFTVTKQDLLPPKRPQLILECELEASRYALRLGDFVVDVSSVEEPKRQSLIDQYSQSSIFVNPDDRTVLADQPTFIILPDSLRQYVNSVGPVVTLMNSTEASGKCHKTISEISFLLF